ncbi:GspH/FimT family pseudopilin [Xanthomonas hyacinthi]|uniref:GspH/FimT family pseudopilin n=1 Tax=Xanthomonas hyacinthi TaxID=56455 RepID=UPI000A427E84
MPNPLCLTTHSCAQRVRPTGFTLVESLITMAVLAILVAVGLPSFGRFVATQRAIATTNLLVGHIAATRASAVHRARDVVLCPSQNGTTCLAAGTDWSAGWIAFVDPDGNRTPGSPADILLVEARPADGPLRIHSTPGRTSLRYRADGYSTGTNLTLSVCVADRRLSKIVVNNSGRPRSEHSPGGESCD